ncbi:hypothetical protein ACFE04_011729 [Oxalis oulophora]
MCEVEIGHTKNLKARLMCKIGVEYVEDPRSRFMCETGVEYVEDAKARLMCENEVEYVEDPIARLMCEVGVEYVEDQRARHRCEVGVKYVDDSRARLIKYYCTVWDEKDDQIIQFVAYDKNGHNKDKFCGSIHICEWVVRDNGLYVHNVFNDFTFFITNWRKKSSNGISPQASIQEAV